LDLHVEFPDAEITANERARKKYERHRRWIKPIFRLLKKGWALDRAIASAIGQPATFLDASCGESRLLLRAQKAGATVCVGNDVSWSQIELLLGDLSPDLRYKIAFTNHNIVALPFKANVFDVAICKDTLHHLGSPAEWHLVLNNLIRVAQKVIIVEVEDPTQRVISRVLNKYYYKGWLEDTGKCPWSYRQFRDCIQGYVNLRPELDAKISKHQSLHSNHMIAEIWKRQSPRGGEGVEA
jgi:ubiquinone/menaquinone biosynthesis C-methylase UbiE